MLAPEDIPEHLGPATQAALSWINLQRASNYSLTGMIGADDLERADGPFEVGLVLCDGEICAREQIRIIPDGDSYQFKFGAEVEPDIPPLLDPPVGVRREWLDKQLGKYEFVLLLYYRGLW
jgi:hypothetical protein